MVKNKVNIDKNAFWAKIKLPTAETVGNN